jgi:5-methylcytosine-specific restriction endonuclease McrA
MKELNYSITNELNEYDVIAAAKRTPSRTILIGLRGNVQPHYQNYLKRFGSIQGQPANPFNASQSLNLNNCYYNSTAPLNGLKKRLIDSQTDTFKFLCPYCLISNHSTFDHYIPIEEHPVFGVLAKNLVPCCDGCNKRKLEYWTDNNQRAIIHFYNDAIPNTNFLHCDLTFKGTIPVLSYRLDFTGVKPKVRTRITKHFTRLDLLNRYNEAAPSVISNINTDVQSLGVMKPTRPAIGRFLTAKATELRASHGTNYWGALAYNALGNSQPYLRSI